MKLFTETRTRYSPFDEIRRVSNNDEDHYILYNYYGNSNYTKLRAEIPHKNNERHGYCRWWSNTGKIYISEYCINGNLEGEHIENPSLTEEMNNWTATYFKI